MYTILRESRLSNHKLTVVVPCYNQEHYIIDCLDSIFRQKVDFEFDVVVVDDSSTDNTVSLVLKHKQLLDHESTVVRFNSNQYSQGRWAVVSILNDLVTAEYIAFLEGDDVWINDTKLTRQVELLDKFPQASIACSDVEEFTENVPSAATSESRSCTIRVLTLSNLWDGNKVMTCSSMFRRVTIAELKSWVSLAPLLDYALTLYSLKNGRFVLYENRKLAGYRLSNTGVHSPLLSTPSGIFKVFKNTLITMLTVFINGDFERNELMYGAKSIIKVLILVVERAPIVVITRTLLRKVYRTIFKN
jgi:glycosyltransferase involved in cell wall biosynthesis